jgi:hypothetical protein
MARPWPDDHAKLIRTQWELEKPRLLPLPLHASPCERREEVRIGKTPYARFDLNDYSVPWRLTLKTLTVWASENQVKIFDGITLVATHERSYARQQRIIDDSHLSGLHDQAPGAEHLQGRDRVLRILPESRDYLDQVHAEQGRTSRAVETIERLVAKYGKDAVREAIQKSVELKRYDTWFLRTATKRIHLNHGAPPPKPLYLPDRDDVRNLSIEKRDLNRYDQLSKNPPNQEPTK